MTDWYCRPIEENSDKKSANRAPVRKFRQIIHRSKAAASIPRDAAAFAFSLPRIGRRSLVHGLLGGPLVVRGMGQALGHAGAGASHRESFVIHLRA